MILPIFFFCDFSHGFSWVESNPPNMKHPILILNPNDVEISGKNVTWFLGGVEFERGMGLLISLHPILSHYILMLLVIFQGYSYDSSIFFPMFIAF